MALSTAVISYDISDMVGVDFDARRTKIWVTTNVPGDAIIDVDGAQIRLGDGLGSLDEDGTGSIQVWIPSGDGNPTSWQTYIHVDHSDRRPAGVGGKREVRTFGPFTIEGDTDLAYLVAEQEVPPTYLSQVTAELQTYVNAASDFADDSSASAGAAEQARLAAEALILSDLGTTDGQTRALVENPASQTAVALGAAYSLRGSDVQGRLNPLARISKVSGAPFRVYAIGTSIANFDNSVLKNFISALQVRYGISRWTQNNFGVQGGDYTADYAGWKKQNYGGLSFTRLRGDSTATPIVIAFYGDFLRLEFSRETNSAAAAVTIDGTTTGITGTAPSAGAQAYRQAVTWAGTAGPHVLTITPPAGSGYAYLESAEWGLSTRSGVEYIDATLGGSGLSWLTTLPATSLPTARPAISGNNGLDYHFTRTDVDLFLVEHGMNDGYTAAYRGAIDYVIAKTALIGVPVVFVVEPYNDYATNVVRRQQREYLLTEAGKHNHVTVIDWHAMLYADGDVTAMNTLYYGGPSAPSYPHPNTGQTPAIVALCKAAGVRVPDTDGLSYFSATRVARSFYRQSLTQAERLTTKTATISGVSTALSNPLGRSVLVVASDGRTPSANASELVYQATVTRNYVDYSTAIAAGSSDAYGKYLTGPTSTVGLSVNAADVNAAMKLTVRAAGDASSGLLNFVLPAGVRLYDDAGQIVPYTFDNGTTQLTQVIANAGTPGTEAPTYFSYNVRATSASPGNFSIAGGRVYAITMAASDAAVIAAPAVAAGPSSFVTIAEPIHVQASRLFNGNFGTGTLDGWTGPTGTAIAQNSQAAAGKYMAQLPTGGGTLTSDIFPVFGSDSFGVEVIARPNSGTFALTITVAFTDHTGAAVSTVTVKTAPTAAIDGSGSYLSQQSHVGGVLVPPNARFGSVKILGDAAFSVQRVRLLDASEPWVVVSSAASGSGSSPQQDPTGLTLPFNGVWEVNVVATNTVFDIAMASFRCFWRSSVVISASDIIGTNHNSTSGNGDLPVITLTAPTTGGLVKATTTWSAGASRTPAWKYRARLISTLT